MDPPLDLDQRHNGLFHHISTKVLSKSVQNFLSNYAHEQGDTDENIISPAEITNDGQDQ